MYSAKRHVPLETRDIQREKVKGGNPLRKKKKVNACSLKPERKTDWKGGGTMEPGEKRGHQFGHGKGLAHNEGKTKRCAKKKEGTRSLCQED